MTITRQSGIGGPVASAPIPQMTNSRSVARGNLRDAFGTEQKELSRLKAIWRDQVFADPGLTPSACRVGYAMADYMTMERTTLHYRRRGEIVIFPSQKMLQERAFLSPDTIRVSIAQLFARGHLRKLRRGNQFTGSNRYKVIVKDEQR